MSIHVKYSRVPVPRQDICRPCAAQQNSFTTPSASHHYRYEHFPPTEVPLSQQFARIDTGKAAKELGLARYIGWEKTLSDTLSSLRPLLARKDQT